MDIQISTDHNIEGQEAMAADTTDVVARALRPFSDHITRVEVHLGDENGPKAGQNDMRCMLEARIEGRPPIAVTHYADTIQLAVDGAANNLVALIENTLGLPQALRRAERQ